MLLAARWRGEAFCVSEFNILNGMGKRFDICSSVMSLYLKYRMFCVRRTLACVKYWRVLRNVRVYVCVCVSMCVCVCVIARL